MHAYDLLLDFAKINLQNGVSVILDAVIGYGNLRDQLIQIANDTNSNLKIIVCICSDLTLWQNRIENRPEVVDGWTPVDWAEVQRVQTYYEKWTTPHIVVDAVNLLEENFNQIETYIKA